MKTFEELTVNHSKRCRRIKFKLKERQQFLFVLQQRTRDIKFLKRAL